MVWLLRRLPKSLHYAGARRYGRVVRREAAQKR